MNARERAHAIAVKWKNRTVWIGDLSADIEKAIIAAEEAKAKEERERCIGLSDLIATRIWGYCQSVDWGTGKAMMEQREIEKIIIDTLRTRSQAQSEGEREKGE